MTNPSKAKGDKAELEAARLLHDLTGWPVRRKLGAGRADDTGDLDGVPDTTVQVKNYRDTARAVRETLDELPQQQANAGTTFGIGMIRRRGGWAVVMTIEQAATLLREATSPPPVELIGHTMRHIWSDNGHWHVLCECGHHLTGRYQHDVTDAWHAHRDEHENQ